MYDCIKNRRFLRNPKYDFWWKTEGSSWRKIEVVWRRNSSKEEFGCYEGSYCCCQCCQRSRKYRLFIGEFACDTFLGWQEKGRRCRWWRTSQEEEEGCWRSLRRNGNRNCKLFFNPKLALRFPRLILYSFLGHDRRSNSRNSFVWKEEEKEKKEGCRRSWRG